MNSNLKEDLLSILTDELDTYRIILAKTSQQMNMISAMDMIGLQAILHEKDKCINKIETIEKKMSILINQVSHNLFYDRDILPCLKDIEKTIQAIIKIEEVCYNKLSELQIAISEEILQSDKGIHALPV